MHFKSFYCERSYMKRWKWEQTKPNQTENVMDGIEREIWKEYKKWKASHNNFPLDFFIHSSHPNSSFLITSLQLEWRAKAAWNLWLASNTTRWKAGERQRERMENTNTRKHFKMARFLRYLFPLKPIPAILSSGANIFCVCVCVVCKHVHVIYLCAWV